MWLGTAVGAQLNIVPLAQMAMSWRQVIKRLQIWRLVTHVGFVAPLSRYFAFRLLWLFIYGPPLEQQMTAYNPGEFAFLILFATVMFNIVYIFYPMGFCGSALIFTILYLWSRNFSSQEVSIWGLLNIKAFYLPWAFLGVDLLMGMPMAMLYPDLIGIGIGHLYYFLMSLYPMASGNVILKCPIWLSRYMAQFYGKAASGVTPPGGGRSSNTRGGGGGGGGGGFRAFQGQGRTLTD
ncbi:hypothetical protein BSKO_01448 [Bryopsis sp. KO-2023]|nr:hypothetical protein BSKO_01448 [Bryopsis sp. KO-2023]